MVRVTGWSPADLPDQSGRRWLVTGATHGLGEATARAAAAAGATLVLPARTPERARSLAADWAGGPHEVVPLDLGSLASVRAAAAAITGDIDVLVNNAGAMTRTRQETTDGFELMLGTNLLGPFALTNLLLPQVRDRVVIVASNAHPAGVLHHDDPHLRRRRWTVGGAYSASKLGDMLWGLALERRLRGRGVGVQLVHPGWVLSNMYAALGSRALERVVKVASTPLGQSPARSARYTLMAATADLPPCSYVGPDGPGHLRGDPCLMGRSATASDPHEAEWLWGFAAAETGTDLS